MSKDLECPYCNEWQEVCHDDGFGYEEDQAHEMDCSNCGQSIVFYTSIHFSYRPIKEVRA
jgi:transcription elongation factor Elf1